ncbi:MAG: sulfite exporter TauE/SafE family protein [Bacteroidia bacterium]
MSIYLFYVLALLAEIAGTIGGFGSSVFLVPIAGFFFDFKTVLAITGILHVFSNTSKLILFHKGINMRLLLLIGVPSVVFVIVGSYLSDFLYFKYTELILGIFLIVFSVFFFFKPDYKLSQSKINAIGGGSIAGFLAGLIGTGGAIRGLSLAAFDLEKSVFIATSAAIDFGVDFSRSVIYIYNGYLEKELYIIVPVLVIIAFVGSYIGKLVLKYISQERFRNVVLFCIFAIGSLMLWKTIQA